MARERTRYSEQQSTCPEVVHTPWARDVTLPQGISVGEEASKFGEFLKPTADEKAAARVVKLAVQLAAAKVSPGSRAVIVGSRGCGCALPSSGTDVCIEAWKGDAQAVQKLVPLLNAAGYTVTGVFDSQDEVLLQLTYKDSFGVPRTGNVFLCPRPESIHRLLARSLRKQLEARGGAGRAVCLLLRTLLSQSNLNGVAKGGLSGVAIATMVAAVAAGEDPVTAPRRASMSGDEPEEEEEEEEAPNAAAPVAEATEKLLKACFATYGTWNWDATSVGIGAFSGKAHPQAPASILHPFDASANLAEGCLKARQVSAMIQYARLGIAQWEAAGPPQPGQAMTRGVTPLSSVIAHKGLWDRSHALRRMQQVTRPPPIPTPACPPAALPPAPVQPLQPIPCSGSLPSTVTVSSDCGPSLGSTGAGSPPSPAVVSEARQSTGLGTSPQPPLTFEDRTAQSDDGNFTADGEWCRDDQSGLRWVTYP